MNTYVNRIELTGNFWADTDGENSQGLSDRTRETSERRQLPEYDGSRFTPLSNTVFDSCTSNLAAKRRMPGHVPEMESLQRRKNLAHFHTCAFFGPVKSIPVLRNDSGEPKMSSKAAEAVFAQLFGEISVGLNLDNEVRVL